MKQIILALQTYHEVYGKAPGDILDPQGKPLLSWRVWLLPFLEESNLFWAFHRNEPWDSPHNQRLIDRMPKVYRSPWDKGPWDFTTCYLRPVGEGTVFPPGRLDIADQVVAAKLPRVLLVEAAADQAVIWTKPEDLVVDPANPGAGLPRHYRGGFFPNQLALAALGDASVHFVPPADAETMRSFLSPEGEAVTPSRPWYQAFVRFPWQQLAVPAALFGIVAVAGGVRTVLRLSRGKVVSPGEFLWLIVGVHQLLYWVAFILLYRVELAPAPRKEPLLWFLPALGAGMASALPLLVQRFSRAWNLWFGVSGLGWALAVCDSGISNYSRWPEESLLTAASPFVLGIVAYLAAAWTLIGVDYPGFRGRWAHWAGIILCLFPLAWFAVWWLEGTVSPRELFLRVPIIRE